MLKLRSIKNILVRASFVPRYIFWTVFKSGWIQSVLNVYPVNRNYEAIPWFTYGCTQFVENRLNKTMAVLEFGSGNSTKWFASRCKEVLSIEGSIDFYNSFKTELYDIENVEYCLIESDQDHFKWVNESKREFQVVIIDGTNRINCAKNCLKWLSSDGIIIWDDSERTQYEEGYEFLAKCGFKRLDYYGHGPYSPNPWQTSVFYRSRNCLGI